MPACDDGGRVLPPAGDEPADPAEQSEPVCPAVGPVRRTEASIVVIDLEDRVMVEEVNSDGDRIIPSAWNQTRYVAKEEGVPVGAAGNDHQYWVPLVDERLLRLVLRSRYCEELLQWMEFSPISGEESLEALVDLMVEIK